MANIVGTTGDDILVGTSAIDTIDGLAGNDQLSGGAGADTMSGGDDDDILIGGAGADVQQGGAGDDVFLIGSRAEFAVGEAIDGGADADILRYIGSAGTLTLTNLVTNFEQVQIASAAGAITGTAAVNINAAAVGNALLMAGNSGANVLIGTAFNDTLIGNGGHDRLDGGVGDDQLTGGDGNDTYIVDSALDTITETLTGGVDLVQSVITLALGAGTNLEHLTLIGSNNIDGTGNELNNILTGNSGENTLSGGDGVDQLIGSAGDDTLDGGTGADRLAGGTGDDLYFVDDPSDLVIDARNAGIDTVSASVNHTLRSNVENLVLTGGALNGTGNNLNNTIDGNGNDNVLSGLAGNDTLDGGAGQDTVAGGLGDDRVVMLVTTGDVDVANGEAGTDTLVLSGVVGGTGLVTVDLSASDQVTDIGGTADTLLQNNFENLDASGLGVGSSVDVAGNTRNNSLIGSDGNDTLDGGNGNDTLDGGAGDDTLVGGAGNDIYVVDVVGDVVNEAVSGAAGGVDLVQSAITFTLATHGNVEHLTLTGSANVDGTGNARNNILTGNNGDNTLSGGDGNDLLVGGAGNDTLSGQVGNDVLTGDAGNDTLDGGAGTDRMVGGLGDDIYVVDATRDRVTEAANAGVDAVRSSVTYTLGRHLEHLVLTGGGNINGTGNSLDNELTGNSGSNVLTAGAGNDTLIGGDGNDVLNGGTGTDDMAGGLGDDTYVVDSLSDQITELANEGADTVQINGSIDLTVGAFTEIEHIVLIGTGAFNATGDNGDNSLIGNATKNTISGGDGNDTLAGNGGNDTLNGGAGNDVLNGGTGNDVMTGGLGDDTYVIDSVKDQITELAGEGTDTVQINRTVNLNVAAFAEIEHVVLTGTAAINATGDGGNNNLTGNNGANTLTGGAGSDVVVGGLGDDRIVMLVSAGDVDAADGGGGQDTLVLSGAVGGTGLVTVDLSASDQVTDIGGVADAALTQENFEHLDASGLDVGGTVSVTGSAGDNVITGTGGADSLSGGAGHDTLNGDAGNDALDGGNGNDTLNGGTGNDALDGGAGNDTYIIDSTSDTITEALNEGTDLVRSTVSKTLGANLENLTLLGSGHLNGTGNGLNNSLTGNSGNNVLTGLAGADNLDGGAGNDTLDGGNDADVLTGGSGNDSLNGGSGNDQLVGGAGNDLFVVGQGDGQDLVQDTSGSADLLVFESGSGIDPLDLVISRQANNLRIMVHGTSDQVTIQNWFSGTASRVETIEAANGQVLLSTQVDRLIQAMATFTAVSGGISWDQALDNPALVPAVQNILAANWQ